MRKLYNLLHETPDSLIERVREDFPGWDISIDENLAFYYWHFENIEAGTKPCTIRYKPDHIRLPKPPIGNLWWIPCSATDPDDRAYKRDMGLLGLSSVLVSTVEDMLEEDAQMDGFADKEEMIAGISDIYNRDLQPNDVLTMYIWTEHDLNELLTMYDLG